MNLQAKLLEKDCDQPIQLSDTIVYSTSGYDIISGNPIEIGASIDPGFEDPIFLVEYSSQNVQDNFYVPSGYTLEKSEKCTSQTDTSILTGMTDYADLLGSIANVAGNVGAFGTAFGGSSTSKSAYNTFYSDYERISVTNATCEAFKLSMNTTSPDSMPQPTP